MNPGILDSSVLAVVLLVAMLACMEIGHRMGLRRLAHGDDSTPSGVIDGAVFALLGLLVAFTFSGAADRFDKRRALIVDEANAIGTAYLRLSLLPPEARDAMRTQFREYVDTRLAIYRAIPDIELAKETLALANHQQQRIWDSAIAASQGSQSATMLLLPAINEMIDISSTRTMAALTHPPRVIFGMLFGLALLSALLAGRSMASREGRPWLHTVVYPLAMAGAVYVIIDMEYPRFGFIRLDAFDSVMVDVRRSMQ